MSDLIDEVSEDLKEERYSYFVQKITRIFIVSAIFTIIAVGLYIWKENNTKKLQAELGSWFHSGIIAAENGKNKEAIEYYDKIISNVGLQYSALAYLNKAAILMKENKIIESQKCLKEMIGSKHLDHALRDLAQNIYLANSISNNLIDDKDSMLILERFAKEGKSWRLSSLQLKALYEIKEKKYKEAKATLNEVLSSKEATRASYDTALSILTTISKTE